MGDEKKTGRKTNEGAPIACDSLGNAEEKHAKYMRGSEKAKGKRNSAMSTWV